MKEVIHGDISTQQRRARLASIQWLESNLLPDDLEFHY
jgi:hypothetical protein